MTEQALWPRYATLADLAAIEAVPLESRGLPESTYALLSRAARRWPDRTALSVLPSGAQWREPRQRTFGQLLADVHRHANLLHELGVRRGDAVALMSPNCAELITATLAAQLAGIAAPLGAGLSRQHLGELLRRCGARVLVTAGPDLAPATWDTAQALARDGLVDTVLVLAPTAPAGALQPLPQLDGVRVGYLADLAAAANPSVFAGDLPRPGDLAAIFHTGGTTGAPKLAAHTHANEVADAWMLAAGSVFDEQTVVFAGLPLFHVNALVVTLLTPLFKGQHVVWAGPLGYRDPDLYQVFWRMVEHYRIAAMSAVPTVYATLTKYPVDAVITSLRHPMVGASPLPAAVREGFQKHTGSTLVEGYGLTEATCASARTFPETPRPGSVGQRLPYQQIKTIAVAADGTWRDLPAGTTGVLAISGPTVFAGYVTGRGPDGYVLDGLGKLTDGWLDTGDLGHVDADGHVHLAGRAKDLIIRGGHNIDPAIIEATLLAHPQVTAASAVGRPDLHAGEVPVAYVTLAAGATVTGQQLRDWARDRVPDPAAAPKTVTVLDELPTTAVGKLYRPALRMDALRAELDAALRGIAGIHDIHIAVEGSRLVATITVQTTAHQAAVKAVLDRYAIAWRTEVKQ
ncbi:acyl-CoA synthetase [Catellatospora sp. IY07-71]|uniref:acyl-CoA synthetase n=1 Tax=Catellatospora sp. IY07-71 TaxID=2728827 RepID=UPI001BB40863|nr:acyl-CoA synthetase [Catellatospora sp. IY07-71]BCJ75075.1 acyl-CoA synthetase [Catellatospora sp. IY07-71]